MSKWKKRTQIESLKLIFNFLIFSIFVTWLKFLCFNILKICLYYILLQNHRQNPSWPTDWCVSCRRQISPKTPTTCLVSIPLLCSALSRHFGLASAPALHGQSLRSAWRSCQQIGWQQPCSLLDYSGTSGDPSLCETPAGWVTRRQLLLIFFYHRSSLSTSFSVPSVNKGQFRAGVTSTRLLFLPTSLLVTHVLAVVN